MRIEAASAQLEALETEAALDRPENLRGRLAALQTVANLADLIAWRPAAEGWPALEARTAQQRARFERANARYYAGLRLQIRRGRYTRDALRQILDGYTSYVPGHTHHLLTGPDQLDLLLDGLLDLPPIPVGRATAPAPEASPYEPAPARAALQMCDLCNQASLAPGERFYDIGAGAGRMVILFHLLTGQRAAGVELDPALCAQARHAARRLGLAGVTFQAADAQATDYRDGRVFFLFTPCHGTAWRALMDNLARTSQSRRLTLFTLGPCTFEAAREPWLTGPPGSGLHRSRLARFESR